MRPSVICKIRNNMNSRSCCKSSVCNQKCWNVLPTTSRYGPTLFASSEAKSDGDVATLTRQFTSSCYFPGFGHLFPIGPVSPSLSLAPFGRTNAVTSPLTFYCWRRKTRCALTARAVHTLQHLQRETREVQQLFLLCSFPYFAKGQSSPVAPNLHHTVHFTK
jgi:hypothetical protein